MNKVNVNRSIKIIARFLKTAREQSKWTQKQLAEKVGCTQQTISRFENGELNNLYIAFFYTVYFDTTILNGTNAQELL